jgi:hypothetical protein
MFASLHLPDGAAQICGGILIAFFHVFFDRRDITLSKEIKLQRLIKLRDMASYPLQGHGRVFDLLITIMSQYRLQLGVLRRLGALIVPIDRFQLLINETMAR